MKETKKFVPDKDEKLKSDFTKEELQEQVRQLRNSYAELLRDFRVLQSINQDVNRLAGYYKEKYYEYRQKLNPDDKPTLPMYDMTAPIIDLNKEKDENDKSKD